MNCTQYRHGFTGTTTDGVINSRLRTPVRIKLAIDLLYLTRIITLIAGRFAVVDLQLARSKTATGILTDMFESAHINRGRNE